MHFENSIRWLQQAARGRRGKLLILRFTPRGRRWPRLLTTRSCRISSNTASWKAFLSRGGNGTVERELATKDPHGVQKGEPVGIFSYLQGRLMHQTADGALPAEPPGSERHEQTTGLGTAAAMQQPGSVGVNGSSVDLILQVAATERAWVAVDADGKTVLQKVINPKEVEKLTAQDTFDVTVGNASGIVLTLNGETLKRLGRRGEVKSVHLTREDLKKPAPERNERHEQTTGLGTTGAMQQPGSVGVNGSSVDLILQVAATERAWVAVDADGTTVVQKVFDPKEVEIVKAKDSFDVTVGNALGIVLTLNGETLKPLGQRGEVKSVHLKRQDLKNSAPER